MICVYSIIEKIFLYRDLFKYCYRYVCADISTSLEDKMNYLNEKLESILGIISK